MSALVANAFNAGGMHIYESTSGRAVQFGVLNNSGVLLLWTTYLPSITGSSNAAGTTLPLSNGTFAYGSAGVSYPIYLEIELAAGIIYFRFSPTGYDGSFVLLSSETVTTHFTTAPDSIGLGGFADNGSTSFVGFFDWFRQEA
jgi:hypothetical protein